MKRVGGERIPPPIPMVEIREEHREDFQEIRQVIVAAGGGDSDDSAADLVELLRDRNKVLVALVAVSSNKVVGHIMFSPVSTSLAPADFHAVALAPLMVLPEFQKQGIGSMLRAKAGGPAEKD